MLEWLIFQYISWLAIQHKYDLLLLASDWVGEGDLEEKLSEYEFLFLVFSLDPIVFFKSSLNISVGNEVSTHKYELLFDGLHLVDLSECIAEVSAALKRDHVDLDSFVTLILDKAVDLPAHRTSRDKDISDFVHE